MPSLREKMAVHGFESNDDYEYQVRCLLQGNDRTLPALNIEGDSDRRKTAFANALARALDYPHVLYHDFTQLHPPLPDVILPPSQDEQGREEAPIDPLDQILSEACALSEAEPTVLTLDQLQAADFREHIRIYHFLQHAEWRFRDAIYYANRKNLLVFLISEQPLYHSLQKNSFRVWVNRVSNRRIDYQPQDFGLGEEARMTMEALGQLFAIAGTVPTRSEYERILEDVQHRIRTREHLRHSIYGRTEGVDRVLLYSPEMDQALDEVIRAIEVYIGLDEVELKSPER